MRRICFVIAMLAGACGDDDRGLDAFYPTIPPATGEAQQAFAGEVTDPGQLVTGPAVTGLVGDFFMKNDKATFIIQAPSRVIGVIPQGGNVIDVVLTDGTHQTVEDHFGELGLIYLLGRTCEPDRIEIIRDGSGGGVAALRTIGKTGNDDFLNIKGIGILTVDEAVDPDVDDGMQCATTYVLAPGGTTLEVYHSLFNTSGHEITGPLGTIADTGGNTEAWTNTLGFERSDISALATLGTPHPIDYVAYQGPGVAYGVIPRHAEETVHAQALIAGVSLLLDGNSSLLDILQKDKYFLKLPAGGGLLQRYDLVVGTDVSAIDDVWRTARGETLRAIAGKVDLSGGGAALGARVGVFLDANGNGLIDAGTIDADGDGRPDERAVTYFDVAGDGSYHGNVPTSAGNLLVRAEVKNVGRSPAMPLADTVNLVVPSPIKVDYQILDEATGQPIPGRLLVVGDHPAFPDKRVFEVYDRVDGIVTSQHCIRGTTVDAGDGVDPPLYLPAGGTYRIYASRGTEWSVASQPVTGSANVNLTFGLAHVNPATGYLATDWHVHQVGSPDSPVLSDERIRSAVSAGIEMFSVTDHDYISDLQPLVQSMHVDSLLRVIPGIEVTPFAYGHYNAWPMTVDNDSANHGAIDWARGQNDFAMVPDEIYASMRQRGAKMVQVNHPRGSGFTEFQAGFSRANVKYDFANHTIYGDYATASVPPDFLRLPETSLWSDKFNGLEVWNGFNMFDTNADGIRENRSLDLVLADWLSMLSMGFYVTPAGNSDTHTTNADAVGMPRTYVRVGDDSATALQDGSAVDAVIATQTGANNTARDIVITNGPMITVTGGGVSALGSVVPGNMLPLTVTVTSPDWAEFDTIEVFANSTPEPTSGVNASSVVQPLKCWTNRPIALLDAKDPCKTAALPAEALAIDLASVAGSHKRYQVTFTVTFDATEIATRAGATGKDAWLVFRARGDRAAFPILPANAVTAETMPALVSGDFAAIRTALTGKGVSAMALTAPVFIDFDGGGYRAPFQP
ncbi:MAG: CehA/McbA family metallohydrolase [Proteobacteria bacterium]|nr:CehA/McbA family metallohydrolase [Pseudomonadota bacterium]